MQHNLKDYNKIAEIAGFKNIKFNKAEEFLKTKREERFQKIELQFFDAELVATEDHLYFAIINALQAFKNKRNISKTIAMETMLYASAQRQIQKAIQRSGLKPETTNLAVVAISEELSQIEILLRSIATFVGAERDDSVLEISQLKETRIMKTFGISEREIQTIIRDGNQREAIANLVVERVALLATQL